MQTRLKAVVLAAGKGTRLQTEGDDAPKVMRTVCGKPLLSYVLDALDFIEKKDIIIVAGYKKEQVIDSFPGYTFAVQTEQLGTGHAAASARTELLGFDGAALICCGDMPAIRRETYKALVDVHFSQNNDCTILTGESSVPLPYGRILRDETGHYLRTVEERDCTPEQRQITELNSGVYIFNTRLLLNALSKLSRDNSQGEYYLTDVPAIMLSGGGRVGVCKRELGSEIIGVNTAEQLAQIERILSGMLQN